MNEEVTWESVQTESGSPTAIAEYTTVTKRLRRVSRFDLTLVRAAALANSATEIALNFADYIDYNDRNVRDYNSLSAKTRQFIEALESSVNLPITLIGTGPEQGALVDRRANHLLQRRTI